MKVFVHSPMSVIFPKMKNFNFFLKHFTKFSQKTVPREFCFSVAEILALQLYLKNTSIMWVFLKILWKFSGHLLCITLLLSCFWKLVTIWILQTFQKKSFIVVLQNKSILKVSLEIPVWSSLFFFNEVASCRPVNVEKSSTIGFVMYFSTFFRAAVL